MKRLPPQISRIQGRKVLQEDVYNTVPQEVKQYITRINQMYIECDEIWKTFISSQNNELVRTLFEKLLTMLNYIIINIFQYRFFPAKKQLIEVLGSSISELFNTINNSPYENITQYGSHFKKAYDNIFKLDYDLPNDDFHRETLDIDEIPNTILNIERQETYTNTLTDIQKDLIQILGSVLARVDISRINIVTWIEKNLRTQIILCIRNNIKESILSKYIKSSLASISLEKRDLLSKLISKFYKNEKLLNNISPLKTFINNLSIHINNFRTFAPEIITNDDSKNKLEEIGIQARRIYLSLNLLKEEIYIANYIFPNIHNSNIVTIIKLIEKGWNTENKRLNALDYTNPDVNNIVLNKLPTKKYILSFIPLIINDTDIEFYGKIAFNIGINLNDLKKSIKINRSKEEQITIYNKIELAFNKEKLYQIDSYFDNIIHKFYTPPDIKTIEKDLKWIYDNYERLHNITGPQYDQYENYLNGIKQLLLDIQEEKEFERQKEVYIEKSNLPITKETSLPKSLSASSGKSHNYEDSSYHRHEKFSRKRTIPEGLPPLNTRDRRSLLKHLKNTCKFMFDIYSRDRFHRLPLRKLELIIDIGKDDKKSCYSVRDLYDAWKVAVKDGKVLKDGYTGEIISDEDLNKILDKIRYIKHDRIDPRILATRPSDKLKFTADLLSIDDIGYFHIVINREITNISKLVYDLGYIPGNIEPGDIRYNNGTSSQDLASSILINRIRELFERGLLLTNNLPPYKCCSIHLGKTPEYWVNGLNNENDIYIKGVSRYRFIKMFSEVNNTLGLPLIDITEIEPKPITVPE